MSDRPQDDQGDLTDLPDAPIIVRTMNDPEQRPNRRFDDHIVLRDTTRTQITATHSEIIDQNTGEFHHNAVKIESVAKPTSSRMITVPKTIWIEDDGRDEIGRLRDFLSAIKGGIPEAVGRYMVVRLEEGQDQSEALYRLIATASSSAKAEALIKVVEGISVDPDALRNLVELAAESPETTKATAAALNIARYREALANLEELVNRNALEPELQRHLEEHYWLFGSEYSERLELRRATRDEIQDFIVRRTTDDYIEIIEIKRTLDGARLFNWDESHQSFYPSVPLAKVVGQVINYIEELDANRSELLRRDGLDTNKIRAKIVIGRSIDDDQLAALRNFNGHLHRIEVLTYDQLLRIGQRILDHLESMIQGEGHQAQSPVVRGTVGAPAIDLTWDEEPPF
jgi:hypothetical protein